MHLQDCQPGTRVVIGMRYLWVGLGGGAATIIWAETPERWTQRVREQREVWGDDPDPYANGMVQVRLDDDLEWGCREPYFDARDLAPMPSLQALSDRICRVDGENRPITADDLRDARHDQE